MKFPDDSQRLANALAMIERRRRDHCEPPPYIDIGEVRRRVGMSQREFARRFGFPVATLRHWERGDRRPRGAALVLLNVIARNPDAVLRALRAAP